MSRSRDRLGRPLPEAAGGVVEPEPPVLPPEEAIRAGQRLIDEGRAFFAHEVFEAVWKTTDGDERHLWRGLAQLAVAVTHAQRGNANGAAALLHRSADTLSPWAGDHPHGLAIDRLRTWALASIDQPLAATTPPPLMGADDAAS